MMVEMTFSDRMRHWNRHDTEKFGKPAESCPLCLIYKAGFRSVRNEWLPTSVYPPLEFVEEILKETKEEAA